MPEKIIIHVDPEIVDLVPKYLDKRKGDIESIKQYLANGDFEAIRVLGHKMHGSGKLFGFDLISTIGESFEDLALLKDSQRIKEALDTLIDFLQRVELTS